MIERRTTASPTSPTIVKANSTNTAAPAASATRSVRVLSMTRTLRPSGLAPAFTIESKRTRSHSPGSSLGGSTASVSPLGRGRRGSRTPAPPDPGSPGLRPRPERRERERCLVPRSRCSGPSPSEESGPSTTRITADAMGARNGRRAAASREPRSGSESAAPAWHREFYSCLKAVTAGFAAGSRSKHPLSPHPCRLLLLGVGGACSSLSTLLALTAACAAPLLVAGCGAAR